MLNITAPKNTFKDWVVLKTINKNTKINKYVTLKKSVFVALMFNL